MAMDAITPNKDKARAEPIKRPTVQEAEEAVRTLIAWAGDDPRREGLLDTPKRVVNAYKLRNIDVESHCEHHMAPFLGKAYVAYMPSAAVVGISKLARVVEIFSKRLQTQETMTAQICDAITDSLAPMGTAVLIDAVHECMSTRGVHHKDVSTITTQFTGVFKSDADLRNRFLRMAGKG